MGRGWVKKTSTTLGHWQRGGGAVKWLGTGTEWSINNRSQNSWWWGEVDRTVWTLMSSDGPPPVHGGRLEGGISGHVPALLVGPFGWDTLPAPMMSKVPGVCVNCRWWGHHLVEKFSVGGITQPANLIGLPKTQAWQKPEFTTLRVRGFGKVHLSCVMRHLKWYVNSHCLEST